MTLLTLAGTPRKLKGFENVDRIPEDARRIAEAPVYWITPNGDVFREPRSSKRKGRPRKIMARPGYAGRLYVKLTMNGVKKHRLINRLVAEAFIGPPPSPAHFACHNDDDHLNNHFSNLRWGTVQDNTDDRQRRGRTPVGERAHNAKLTEAAVRYIRTSDESERALGRRFGVSANTVSRARSRLTWRHLA